MEFVAFKVLKIGPELDALRECLHSEHGMNVKSEDGSDLQIGSWVEIDGDLAGVVERLGRCNREWPTLLEAGERRS